jgi:hypothetical protein
MIPFCGRPVALPEEASLLQTISNMLLGFSRKGPANESFSATLEFYYLLTVPPPWRSSWRSSTMYSTA